MPSGPDRLRELLGAARDTGDEGLIARTSRAVWTTICDWARERTGRRRFPIIRRLNAQDIRWLLSDLQ